MTTETAKERHPYIPQRLAVKSMRDSGYKNTSYALAELIDNSYQAIERVQETDDTHVGSIEVIVVEDWEHVEQRKRMRLQEIAVLDNGSGMTAQELRNALQFGNGSHLNDRDGIGRFGMGLPNSTVSQCRRADVWTWKTGSANAIHSYLDLDSIETDDLEEVPEPTSTPIPERWLQIAPSIERSESGTLVVWSKLDRVKWRTAKSTLDNTESLIGRIYRKLIVKGLRLSLTVVSADERETRMVRPNDPLYLMSDTSTPPPFDVKPMFQPYGKDGKQIFEVDFGGQTHEVVVTLSHSTKEARILPDGRDPGHLPHGKHARSNVGVSVVRADRELSLDTSWNINDLRERWWGAEISFPPALDEVFGVTNNKQYATHFTEMAEYYLDTRNDDEWQEVQAAWADEDDPQRHLIQICNYLAKQIDNMRAVLRDQTKGQRSKKKRHEEEVEKAATERFKDREDEGHKAEEADADTDDSTKQRAVERDLLDKRYPAETAREIAELAVANDLRVLFVQKSDPEIPSFFTVDVIPGVTEIVFNTAHPVYELLIAMLDPASSNETPEVLRSRLDDASTTLKLLLAAWARYEAEEKSGERLERLRDIRGDWGRMAKAFLKDMEASATSPQTS